MRKSWMLILAAVMVFALCACSIPGIHNLPELPPFPGTEASPSSAPAPIEEITLKLLVCGDTQARARYFSPDFIEHFEEANPGLRLAVETVTADGAPRLLKVRSADGRAPDLLISDAFPDYLPDELILSADEYCPGELMSDFYSRLLRQGPNGSAPLSLPLSASPHVLLYNAELLAEAGASVPATWDELEEACGLILERFEGEVVPWGLALNAAESASVFADYAWGNGGGFLGADGAWALDSPENAEALAFVVDLVDKGFTGPNPARDSSEELQAQFAEGKIAMLIVSDALADSLREGVGAVDAAIAPVPSNGGGRAASVEAGSVLTVLRAESGDDKARREAIGRFLLFFYESGNHAAWAVSEGALPVLRSAAADPAFAEWREVLENGRSYPDYLPEWDAVCAGLAAVEQQALIGGDIAAALDALQDEIAP